jgi:hypothetical protein
MAEVAGELSTAENIQPVPEYTIGTVPSPMTEGRPEPIFNISAHHLTDDLTRPNFTAGASNNQYAQLPSSSQVQPIPHNDSGSGLRSPLASPKLLNPLHKMFDNLSLSFLFCKRTTCGSLINFLRVLVRIRYMASAFRISTSHLLQIFYGYTKGPLTSKTMVTYIVVTRLKHIMTMCWSSLSPRAILPLLNS